MLLRNSVFIRRFLSVAESISKPGVLTITNTLKMGDTAQCKRKRYDGRSKKRQWEERRRDKGESLITSSEEVLKKAKIKNDDPEVVAERDKFKRRKFCLLLGYSGDSYFGMQRNPHTKTIEEDLLNALYKAKLIEESEYKQVQNMQFQRAARTDKGVSAARQIVSLKMRENVDLAQINEELPEVIRVFGCKRVTKGFNSKSQCDSRTYIYLTPTAAFAPNGKEVSQKDFRLDNETFNKVTELLKHFLGTKNFHNYTSRKKYNDPSANRYMKTFVLEKPFVRNGVEFAILKVQGQSFMLHQIRKMVGCLLAVIRGLAQEDIIEKSFKSEKVIIPRAPGLGLMLEFVHYDRYNNRYGTDGVHEKLTWEECNDQVEQFKEKYIFPTIVNREVEEESMLNWINTKLIKHSYDENEEIESDEEFDEDDEKNYKNENNVENENIEKDKIDENKEGSV